MTELLDRVALVTGAASGIGAAVAAELHRAGARVFCSDLDLQGAEAVSRRLPGATSLALDVSDDASWIAGVSAVVGAAGRLDILVNCAGVAGAGGLAGTTLAEWRRVLAVNLDGAFLGTRHAVQAMGSRGGVILHIGSAVGSRPMAGAIAYSTSKAALRMVAFVAAKECRQAGLPIRVNVLSPAGVKTPMWRSMPFFQELMRATGSEDAAYASITQSGGGPFCEPGDVAKVARFLVSDAACHITGVDVPADDGFVL